MLIYQDTQVCIIVFEFSLILLLIKDLGPDNPAWPGIDPKWVPIIPVTACWDNITGVQFTHTQFPLTMAWAITIHKSQGLTLEKAVIELGPRDFALGLSFVAISRVKSLKGLAFRSPFALGHLQQKQETSSSRMLKADNERRSQMAFQLSTYDMDLTEYQFIDN